MNEQVQQALGAWMPVVSHLFKEPFMANIGEAISRDIDKLQPAYENVFRALTLCQPDKVKVVIIGQDPYPGGEADGLCFSTGTGTRPYSLDIIFKELKAEGFGIRTNTSLEDWAEQGVLLLNTHLTTTKGSVNAHANIGWDRFTGEILRWIIWRVPAAVFMLWGRPAQEVFRKANNHDLANTLLRLECPHPAAQRYGYKFLGCDHFKLANEYLIEHGKKPIEWTSKEELLT